MPGNTGSPFSLRYQLLSDAPDGAALGSDLAADVAGWLGNLYPCTSSTRPAHKAGRAIFETDTKLVYVSDGAAWVDVFGLGAWSSYNPAWTVNGGATPTLGNGVLIGRYKISGKMCRFRIALSLGSTTNGGTTEWLFSLPPGVTAAGVAYSEQVVQCKGYSVGYSDWNGYGLVLPGEAVVRPYLPRSISNAGAGWVRNTDSGGAVGTGVPQIPGAYTFITSANLMIAGTIEIA